MNKMKFRAMSLIVSTLLMVSLGYSQDKVALLIANSDLRVQKLPEAKQKAEIMAAALKSAGFEVTLKENVKSIRKELEKFYPSCPTGGVSLFYYYGAAAQFDKKITVSQRKDENGKTIKKYGTAPDSGVMGEIQIPIIHLMNSQNNMNFAVDHASIFWSLIMHIILK